MFDKISSVYSPLRPIFVEIAQLCKVVQRGGGSPRRRKRCATLARGRHTSADLSADPSEPRFQSRTTTREQKLDQPEIYLQLFRFRRLEPSGGCASIASLTLSLKANHPPGAIIESHFHRVGNRNFADIESVELMGTRHRAEKKEPRDHWCPLVSTRN